MPELPEVETTKQKLEKTILNYAIKEINIIQPSLRYLIPEDFSEGLINQTIIKIQRRAKYLIIYLSQDKLILHLGMSGHLRVELNPLNIRKHDHVVFKLEHLENKKNVSSKNIIYLCFNDPRRFGFIKKFSNQETPDFFNKLGIEPLSKEFTAQYLYHLLKNKKKWLKIAIMDQALVVGVGNIYANEALFLSHLHPEKSCLTLTIDQTDNLVRNIQKTLKLAIDKGGTSLKDFISPDGTLGYFTNHLQVYQRDNQPCYVCKTIIKRKMLGTRATFWCPNCQPL